MSNRLTPVYGPTHRRGPRGLRPPPRLCGGVGGGVSALNVVVETLCVVLVEPVWQLLHEPAAAMLGNTEIVAINGAVYAALRRNPRRDLSSCESFIACVPRYPHSIGFYTLPYLCTQLNVLIVSRT